MKKSIVSLILMVCMILQMVCFNISAENNIASPQPSQEVLSAKDFLVKLGALDETLDVNEIATKST